MKITKILLTGLFIFLIVDGYSQYWQQKVDYKMEIDFDHYTHQFKGVQKLKYTNNSPDELSKVYYHLYFNAFQPESMMDVRSRTIKDPDARVGDRISKLNTDEIGYQKVISLTMNGDTAEIKTVGTILEVMLLNPIEPGQTVELNMVFEAQVPVQIRRSGRRNKEGVDYSMTQWYPKMAEYDKEGWHANPYVGREFHGVWGDFDVTINIDRRFTIGGTGVLQNPAEIGKGYYPRTKKLNQPPLGEKFHWHFVAKNVHDFAWAADPDFVHDIQKLDNGTKIHFLYQVDSLKENWINVQEYTVKSFEYVNKHFGEYPYSDYSIIQGGDGGMEYPMATLITSHGSFSGLVSVIVHESIHSWYQGMMATNESKYPWMDEGFTTYVQNLTLDHLYEKNAVNPNMRSQKSYISLARSNAQEPLTTHADHYKYNGVYGVSVYSKGAVFLDQLSYIIGHNVFMQGMMIYYNEWKFKHPTPEDFKRIMEKVSGIELDWYFEQFIGTINTINYGVAEIEKLSKLKTKIDLVKLGSMPMPLDIKVTLKGGNTIVYNVPLRVMRGEKLKSTYNELILLEDWPWTNPNYSFIIDIPKKKIKSIEIDPSFRMADIDRSDNVYPKPKK